jgi:hypothetical protein
MARQPALCAALGFVRSGIEPRALEAARRFLDEELLVLALDAGAVGDRPFSA